VPLTDIECPDCGIQFHTDHLIGSACPCGFEFTREFFEKHGVSKDYWPIEMFRHTRSELVALLQNEDRHPVDDADKVKVGEDWKTVHLIHLARDGSVELKYEYSTALEGTESGCVYEFDFFEGKDSKTEA